MGFWLETELRDLGNLTLPPVVKSVVYCYHAMISDHRLADCETELFHTSQFLKSKNSTEAKFYIYICNATAYRTIHVYIVGMNGNWGWQRAPL